MDNIKLIKLPVNKDKKPKENIEEVLKIIDEEDPVASIVIVLNRDGSWLHREGGASVPISQLIGMIEWIKSDIIRRANADDGSV